MAYWHWITPAGAQRVAMSEWQRGDVLRALAATQPATLAMIRDRAKRDGTRCDGVLSNAVSYYLWEFRKDGVVDAEKIETAKERAEARAAAAKAPTLADAMMLATMDPITIEEIVAALSALGRADATEPAVREVLAHEGPRFARIQAADGRALYIRRRNAGPKRVPIVVYLTRPDGAALRRRHHPQRTEGGGANATTA